MSFHVSQLLQQMQGQIDLGAARVGLFRATVSEVDTTGRLVRLIRDGSTVAELEWRPVITGALPAVGARVNCLPYYAPGGQTPVISVIGTGAEGASAIADGSVTTGKLADRAVTNIKIAEGTIESFHIRNNDIQTIDLADSSVTRAKRAGGPPQPRWQSGLVYFPYGLQNSLDTFTMFANQLRGVRILPSQAYTVQGVLFEVITAVTGNVRVGIYNEHPTLPQPYQLLWDGGPVSTSTAGIKQVIGAALSRGEEDPYWLVILPSVNVTMRGVVSGKTATGPGLGSSLTSPESAILSINLLNTTYGPLPATLGTPAFSLNGVMLGAIS